MAAIGQAGERIEARQPGDLVRRFALRRDIRRNPAKAQKKPVFIMARRSGQFPPAGFALHLDRKNQVAETFAPLEMIGQTMQSSGETAAFPTLICTL